MKELERLHYHLCETVPKYVSLIAIGSIAAGDPWVEGRSDRDILVILEKVKFFEGDKIKSFVVSQQLDTNYKFVLMPKKYFLANKRDSHDFSGKFRSRTIFGNDIIPLKQIPSRKESLAIYKEGLDDVVTKISVVGLGNAHVWPESTIRQFFWREFKHGLMYLAIRQYCKTGEYPKKRSDLCIKEPNLTNIVETVHEIDNVDKKGILSAASMFLDYIQISEPKRAWYQL